MMNEQVLTTAIENDGGDTNDVQGQDSKDSQDVSTDQIRDTKNVFAGKDSGDLPKPQIFVIPPRAKKIFANTVVFRYTKATDIPPRENIGHAIPLPEDEILKYYCKWERNSIKDVFKKNGLIRTKSKKFWDVYWGGQIKTSKWSDMKGVFKPWKKINHFPGTWALGRKDNLGMNIRNLQRRFAFPHILDFFSPSYTISLHTSHRKIRKCFQVHTGNVRLASR